jgi:ribulose-5-phosphate 4-epimerase/fuculose-1-phosphate aldolase
VATIAHSPASTSLYSLRPEVLLQTTPSGLNWPTPPVFEDAMAARLHLRQRLAASFRIFAMHGFDAGIAGHISARDPILPDHFWVNPLGLHFSRITVSDLVLIDHDGQVVEGRHPVNAAAFSIHSRIHRARPDVVAAAHAHSRHGAAFASLGRLLPPTTQEACAFYEDHAVMQAYGGIASDVSEGDLIAQALGPHKAVICRNHAHFTVGHSVDEAVFWFLRMDRAFEQYLLAAAAGTPLEIEQLTARLTAKQVGSHRAGWFALQPLMDKVIAEQPDLLG